MRVSQRLATPSATFSFAHPTSFGSRSHPQPPFPTLPPCHFLNWLKGLALLALLFHPLSDNAQFGPEAPQSRRLSCSLLHSMSKSPRPFLFAACASHATLPGCCCSIACNATSSTHLTPSRDYKPTLFSHQSRNCQNSFCSLFSWDPRTPSLRLETIADNHGKPAESQCSEDNTSTRKESRRDRDRGTTQHKQPKTNPTLCQITQNVRVKMA